MEPVNRRIAYGVATAAGAEVLEDFFKGFYEKITGQNNTLPKKDNRPDKISSVII
jgi:hypothetical protein